MTKSYGIISSMTPREINAEIERICCIADKRAKSQQRAWQYEGMAQIDFLTTEERARLHDLKLALPSFAEERAAARDRIRERLSKRRNGGRS